MKKFLVLILPVHVEGKRGRRKSFLPPTTLSVLASLTPSDWDVSIIDENIAAYDEKEEYEKIKAADLVGISAMTAQAVRAYEIADDIRKLGRKVVLGGYHVTACPEEAAGHADSIVIGRAEGVWEKLISDVEKGTLKERYESDTEVKFVNPNKRIQPWLTRKQILPAWLRGYMIKHMTYTSAGCVNRCPFCYNSKRKIKFAPRNPDEVREELSLFRGERIAFCDDNIISDYGHARKLFHAIKDLDLKWLGFSSMKIGLPGQKDILDLVAKSGCKWLFIGLETFSEAILKKWKKPNDADKYPEIIRRIHDAGIKVTVSFIIGMEEETMADLEKIIDFVNNESPERVDIFFLTPFPGTVMYDGIDAERINKDWSRFDGQHIVYNLPAQEKKKLIDKFIFLQKNIYSWKSIFARSIFNRNWRFFERLSVFGINRHKRKKFTWILKDL
jgi:radical SAM superfamily enzyme YgiQ (UPF0313 family)